MAYLLSESSLIQKNFAEKLENIPLGQRYLLLNNNNTTMTFSAEIRGELEPDEASSQLEGYFQETARRDTARSSRRDENTELKITAGEKPQSDSFNEEDILGGNHRNDTGNGVLDALAINEPNAMVDADEDEMQERWGLRTPNRNDGAENP